MTKKIIINKDELFDLYINQNKSIKEIAKILNVNILIIYKNLKYFNIVKIELFLEKKFGRLKVIKLDHVKEYISSKGKKYIQKFYLCKCECGKETIVMKQSLLRGKTKSCGCYNREKIKQRMTKHGLSYNRLYFILNSMKQRCYNKNDQAYIYYGGRGIIVCDEWLDNQVCFYNWSISNGYKKGLTIDRIDNNKGYSPENCRWVNMKTQGRNRRSNHLIEYNNEIHCLSEWAEKLGIEREVLKHKLIKSNWCLEKALIY